MCKTDVGALNHWNEIRNSILAVELACLDEEERIVGSIPKLLALQQQLTSSFKSATISKVHCVGISTADLRRELEDEQRVKVLSGEEQNQQIFKNVTAVQSSIDALEGASDLCNQSSSNPIGFANDGELWATIYLQTGRSI